MPITRATNLAGLGTIFDSLTDGGGLSVSGISTFTDLNITRVNITGVGTISNGSITNLTGTSSTITTLRSTTLNADTGNIVTGVTTNFNATNVVITGVTTVSAGTAALPSITPSGDPNTGVFFPAADHLNFSTGGTSRVQIESDGDINIDDSGVFYDATNNRVGIGTSTPEVPLHINRIGDGTYAQSLSESRTKAGFIVNPESSGSSVRLNISKGGIGDLIILQVTNAAGTGAFKILLNPYGGNVGVGHTNPGATLDIKAAAATAPLIIQGTSSEFARFDSSGRLIIGATSASYSTTVKLQANSGSSTGESRIRFCRGQATPADAADLGIIGFSDSTETPSAEIKAQRDGGTWSASSVPGRLTFSTTADGGTSPTERARINSGGFLKASNDATYVSTSAASFHEFRSDRADWVFGITNKNVSPTGMFIGHNTDINNTGNVFLGCYGGENYGTPRAAIRTNGGLANYSANNANLSDRNVKKDITLAAGTWDCIKEWEIVNYRYKDQSDDADLNLGVIAQQVAESCPEVITIFQEAKDATEDKPAQEERLGVKEQQMYWMAIKALQEAQVRIEALEADVSQIKGA